MDIRVLGRRGLRQRDRLRGHLERSTRDGKVVRESCAFSTHDLAQLNANRGGMPPGLGFPIHDSRLGASLTKVTSTGPTNQTFPRGLP